MAKLVQICCLAGIALWPCPASADTVRESARRIPVVAEVDVVVVGGTVPAVIAATAAAERDVEVLLIAPRNYLGEDLCATLHLWYDETMWRDGELTESIFGEDRMATPLRVIPLVATL